VKNKKSSLPSIFAVGLIIIAWAILVGTVIILAR
jgi:hypothetical protein